MRKLLTSSARLAGATSITKLFLLLAIIAATSVAASAARAANIRTWVSGAGNDVDNTQCSLSDPCQTFAHAIAETASGGELDCLDPGDFRPVTITISVTIDCEGASNGGITATSGTAITINTPSIVVNLIGLEINGMNEAFDGVYLDAAAYVSIRNCKIYGFGIDSGIDVRSGTLVVDNVFVAGNGYGIIADSSTGVVNVTVRNSDINNNSQVGILVVGSGGRHAGATIEQTTLAFNSTAMSVSEPGVAVIGGSTIVNNAQGLAGGITYSFKNNQIGGNGTDGTPLTAYPGGPLN